MKKLFYIFAFFTVFCIASEIPKSESPYYFFVHENDTLLSRIHYVSSGKTLSLKQLEYYDSWDSCLFKIDSLELIIVIDDYVFDTSSMIDSIQKYELYDILDRVILNGEYLDSAFKDFIINN